jgi:sortase A
MPSRRVDEIGLEELEQLIAERKAARARGDTLGVSAARPRRFQVALWLDRAMTLVEVAVVVALIAAVVGWFRARDAANEASSANIAASVASLEQARPTPTAAAAITVAYLPGGHTPPTAPGGAQPIEASIPEHLRPLVEIPSPAPLPTVEVRPEHPVRIIIPSINVDAPIVLGDDWESLKLGVGHTPGSANPGERGNMVLSAHNDIFGEIFRRLPDLQLEDEITVETTTHVYRYVVKAKRIIAPDQVEVMAPTREPVVTLISCYPYLIDTQRIVIVGELADKEG